MKKTYINPEMVIVPLMAKQTIAVVSLTHISGTSGLDWGDGDTPTSADVKGMEFNTNIWDDEW